MSLQTVHTTLPTSRRMVNEVNSTWQATALTTADCLSVRKLLQNTVNLNTTISWTHFISVYDGRCSGLTFQVLSKRFTAQCYHSADYAVARCLSVSHSLVLSKRLNVPWKLFHAWYPIVAVFTERIQSTFWNLVYLILGCLCCCGF